MTEQNRLLTKEKVASVTSVQFSDEAWEDVLKALEAQREMTLREVEQVLEIPHQGFWEFGKIIFNPNCRHCKLEALKQGKFPEGG